MTNRQLDLCEIPPPQRHPKIFDAFEELGSGDALRLINDHESTPLYHQMAAEVELFDAEGYTFDRVGPKEFIATPPKKQSEITRSSRSDMRKFDKIRLVGSGSHLDVFDFVDEFVE